MWSETARDAGSLDTWNRALVYNYLASAAEFTAPLLNNQGNDAESAEDARAFARDMRTQDLLRRGYGLTAKGSKILGFGSVSGLVAGAFFGIISLFSQAGAAGENVDLMPLVWKALGTGGVVAYVVRALASAGQAAGSALGEAWERTLARRSRPSVSSLPTWTYFPVRQFHHPAPKRAGPVPVHLPSFLLTLCLGERQCGRIRSGNTTPDGAVLR